jgi:hypothetical protein
VYDGWNWSILEIYIGTFCMTGESSSLLVRKRAINHDFLTTAQHSGMVASRREAARRGNRRS